MASTVFDRGGGCSYIFILILMEHGNVLLSEEML
jgi:hypothetical protein